MSVDSLDPGLLHHLALAAISALIGIGLMIAFGQGHPKTHDEPDPPNSLDPDDRREP